MELINIGTIEIIAMLLVLLLVIGLAFLAGAFYAIGDPQAAQNEPDEIYCFECEIETPYKEKKGKLYCTNCGLYHGKI